MPWDKIAVVLASLAISTLLCEGLLRLLWTNPYRNEHPERLLELRLHHANRDLPIDRSGVNPESPIVPLQTDAYSYLLPEPRFEAPDATVVFLGGSTTECAAVDPDQRFPVLVSQRLSERDLRVNTLNAALSGNTSHDSLNVLLNHVIYDAPDVVVMMHAANDIGWLFKLGSYEARGGGPVQLEMVWRVLGQFGSHYSSLLGAVRRYRSSGPIETGNFEHRGEIEQETAEIPIEEFEYRLRAYVRSARAFEIEPVLMTQPMITMRTDLTPDWMDATNQQRFNSIIRQVAAEEDAVLIDLVAHLIQHVPEWDEPGHIFYDGVHVTTFGSQRYADYIAERLAETVLRPENFGR